MARKNTQKKHFKLALVLNILDEEYQTSIFSGIKKQAQLKDVEIICCQNENPLIHDTALAVRLPSKDFFDVDGVILISSVFSDSPNLHDINSISELWPGIPVVSAGQKIQGTVSVTIRSKNAMEELTNHLLEVHNYKKFLYLSGLEDHMDSKERKAIFERIMQKQMKTDPEIQYECVTGYFSELASLEIISQYINEHKNEPVDVIVCANDNMALGVYKYLKSQNTNSLWENCAVTGFDDIPQAEIEVPAFTTVHQPLKELGEKAVEILLRLIQGKKTPQITYVDSNFVTRESCGCVISPSILFSKTERKLTSIQKSFFQSEQLLRRMSHFGQQLNSCAKLDGLCYTLDTNLTLIGVDDFALYIFDKPITETKIEKNKEIKALEAFLRRHGTSITTSGKFRKDNLKVFLSELSDDQTHSLVVKILFTTAGISGCIVYDAPQSLHPYICSISTNIAQTIYRLQTMAQKQKYSEQLEKAVNKRTKELIAMNNKRIQVEAEVLKISEMERQRFSTDLHDDICQRLAGLAMLCRCYSTAEKQITREQMVELTELITDTLQTTRQYAHNSFPVDLDSLGMKDSLSNMCNDFQNQSKIHCSYKWELPENKIFTRPQAINIFRIIQEALQNIMKHSEATETSVEISTRKKKVYITIADNGKGIIENPRKSNGIGMKSMQYRTDQINGTFSVSANIPSGTKIEITMDEQNLINCPEN